MFLILEFVVLLAAIALAVPMTVLAAEVLLARRAGSSVPLATIHHVISGAIIVPAHNEEAGISDSLISIREQLSEADRLIVVADNCTDDTARVAAACGAEVTIRNDADLRGKGYALDWGIKFLGAGCPDVVIVIDADCTLGSGVIERLKRQCVHTGRPVQALDQMIEPAGSEISHKVALFAWRVKNYLRPLGLHQAGLPCQLMGTGMAFPRDVLQVTSLASGDLTEDLSLGLELAKIGRAARFCPSAAVSSAFPTTAEATLNQRRRWEHGHLRTILTKAVPYLLSGISKRNWELVALSLDVMVPPLTLFGMLLFLLMTLGIIGLFAGLMTWLFVWSLTLLLVYAAVLVWSWLIVGRDVLPIRALGLSLPYIAGKARVHGRALFRGFESSWIRTDRNPKIRS